MSSFTLTVITNDVALARRADVAGVDRIGVDIERLAKRTRQGHIPGARISDHELADLVALREAVRCAVLFARLNSLHAQSNVEIDAAIAAGARVLMLPFFTGPAEVERFVRLVDERAGVSLLLETWPALVRLHDVLAVDGVGEVMVGLNDLQFATSIRNPFELVASDIMATVAESVLARGRAFGFGGLARADDEALPVPADLVIAQHARLGSTSAWLARSFFGGPAEDANLVDEVAKLRARIAFWSTQSPEVLRTERERLRRHLLQRAV